MTLRLYLDDCAFSRALLRLLREAGHDVETPSDVQPPLTGAEDAVHLAHAADAGRAVLTYNVADFHQLHRIRPQHSGILIVGLDNDVSRDMTNRDIVRAIRNLLNTVGSVDGDLYILNAFRW